VQKWNAKSLGKNMKILVVGGAGYIGSHMVKQLLRGGHAVVTLDDLSTGYRDAVLGGSFIQGCVSDRALLDRVFAEHRFDAVFHFASFIQIGESVAHPAKYYANNLANTLNLLDAMVRHEIKHFIFSSSAAIFGEPRNIRIDEDHPTTPINPYGASKAMVEQILRDFDRAYGLKSVSLRYFNACGADPEGELGERHDPETHLIPLALQSVSGRRESLTVFGRDYNTPDGTCIRDYVHVCDLCDAHLLALEYLQDGAASNAFNLGNGDGFSVQQVIDTISIVTGKTVSVINGPRRPGDPACLVADASKAKKSLGWETRYSDLDVIVSHAWAWETKRLCLGI
jgi:UDP-glucose 4-epimerase